MNRIFKIAGYGKRGKEYFSKGIYARDAFSGIWLGYMIYIICIIMGGA